MADETRGAWDKPQLIVLARNRPEETVLLNCKTGGAGGLSSEAVNSGCWYMIPCEICNDLVSS